MAPKKPSDKIKEEKVTFPSMQTPVADLIMLQVNQIHMRFDYDLYKIGMTHNDGRTFEAGYGTGFTDNYTLTGKPQLTEIEVYFNENEFTIASLVFKHEDGSSQKFGGKWKSERMERVVLQPGERLIGAECEKHDGFDTLYSITFLVLKCQN